MKKAIEWLLFNSNVSRYQVSKDTGVAQTTLSRYVTGESDVGKMTLDNAETLYNYFKQVLADVGQDSIHHEGKEIFLTQGPYIDGTHESPYYRAHAIDLEGNEYKVTWDVVEGYEQLEDAADHCDWDNPSDVQQI